MMLHKGRILKSKSLDKKCNFYKYQKYILNKNLTKYIERHLKYLYIKIKNTI